MGRSTRCRSGFSRDRQRCVKFGSRLKPLLQCLSGQWFAGPAFPITPATRKNGRLMKIDVILEAGLPAARVETLAVQAERYGVQTLWVASFPGRRDPVPALALASRATTRIRLATLPVSPYEVHPLRLADQLLTLNELSNGRATILIGGLGHSVSRVTGLQPTRRVTAVRDTIRILKGLRPDADARLPGRALQPGELPGRVGHVTTAAHLRWRHL